MRRLGAVVVLLTLVAILMVVVVRAAWVSDDAFITFRTIDNALQGYGLRWNVTERVQSYTHPLWLLILLPIVAATGNPYISALAVSLGLTLVTVVLVLLARHRSEGDGPAAHPIGVALMYRSHRDDLLEGLHRLLHVGPRERAVARRPRGAHARDGGATRHGMAGGGRRGARQPRGPDAAGPAGSRGPDRARCIDCEPTHAASVCRRRAADRRVGNLQRHLLRRALPQHRLCQVGDWHPHARPRAARHALSHRFGEARSGHALRHRRGRRQFDRH